MVFNATFNKTSAILWRSVLFVEETGENHRPVPSPWKTLLHNVVSSTMIWLKYCLMVLNNKLQYSNLVNFIISPLNLIFRQYCQERILSLVLYGNIICRENKNCMFGLKEFRLIIYKQLISHCKKKKGQMKKYF